MDGITEFILFCILITIIILAGGIMHYYGMQDTRAKEHAETMKENELFTNCKELTKQVDGALVCKK